MNPDTALPGANAPPDLAALLDTHQRPLERIAVSYARSHADRGDLPKDSAVALCTALPSFRGECSEKTFVLRVAHNRAITFLSKRGRPPLDVDAHDAGATSGKNLAVAYERTEEGRSSNGLRIFSTQCSRSQQRDRRSSSQGHRATARVPTQHHRGPPEGTPCSHRGRSGRRGCVACARQHPRGLTWHANC